MIRNRSALRVLALSCLSWSVFALEATGQNAAPDPWIKLTVKAGSHDHGNCPVAFELPEGRLRLRARQELNFGPIALYLRPQIKDGEPPSSISFAQVARDPAGPMLRGQFLLPRPLRNGEEETYYVSIDGGGTGVSVGGGASTPIPSWSLSEIEPGRLELKHGKIMTGYRPVFRYNAAPVSSPNYGPIQIRDAYIHPAYSPSGALITGDFSSSHPHHRGFFLAYEKTKTGDLAPDFWNIHQGTGKISSEGFDKPVVGPVTARFKTRHRWEAKDKATGKSTVVLRETWDVEAYDIPNAAYWLFDITSTQQAVDRPLELLPYRYGGMAYRGPEPFVKGKLDVLTSEGLHRRDGDQKHARWVDLTGPVADGSETYAGAMIADHPANPHYPTVARIHPTTLPFFCFVPAHDKPLTIAADKPTVFRYRVLIHDGHPDKDLDERVARDFAEPPVVVVE